MGETDSAAKTPAEGTMTPKGSENSKKATVYPLMEQLAQSMAKWKGGRGASLVEGQGTQDEA